MQGPACAILLKRATVAAIPVKTRSNMSRSVPLYFAILLAILPFGCSQTEPAHIAIDVLSSQPHLVTGGNALIEVTTNVADEAALIVSIDGVVVPLEFTAHGSVEMQ